MALALSSIQKLVRNGNGPLYIHFQYNCLKAYDCKNYVPSELFNYQQIKLDEGTRKKLSDVGIAYLEDLGIISLYQKLSFVFVDLFINCIYTRDQLSNFLFCLFRYYSS